MQAAAWLRRLSYTPALNGLISLPSIITQVSEISQLQNSQDCHNFFVGRAIMTLNEVTIDMNAEMLGQIQGEKLDPFSTDTVSDVEDRNMQEYSTESLQGINLAGLPLSKLSLKIGAPVMLLRNLDQPNGLNNSSRIIIERIGCHVIAGTLIGGDHAGQMRIIPRIPLSSTEGDLAFILTCRQFPVRLCFAIIINKSQGQTLKIAGLDLRVPVFTHGQLYVALSRVTDVSNLTVLLPERAEGKTVNIVYPEVLDHMREEPEVATFVAILQAEERDIDMIDN